jgi:hypothetical protein
LGSTQVGRRLREQDAQGATRGSSQFSVGTAGENYRDFSSHHNSRRYCSGQVLKLLKENISGFQIGDQQKIRVSRDRRFDHLDPSGVARNGIIEGEWAIDDGASNLSAINHFAESGGIKR